MLIGGASDVFGVILAQPVASSCHASVFSEASRRRLGQGESSLLTLTHSAARKHSNALRIASLMTYDLLINNNHILKVKPIYRIIIIIVI